MNQDRYLLLVVSVVAIGGVFALAPKVPGNSLAGGVTSAAETNQNFAAVDMAVTALESTGPGMASAGLNSHSQLVAVGVVQTIRSVTIEVPAAGSCAYHLLAEVVAGAGPPDQGDPACVRGDGEHTCGAAGGRPMIVTCGAFRRPGRAAGATLGSPIDGSCRCSMQLRRPSSGRRATQQAAINVRVGGGP